MTTNDLPHDLARRLAKLALSADLGEVDALVLRALTIGAQALEEIHASAFAPVGVVKLVRRAEGHHDPDPDLRAEVRRTLAEEAPAICAVRVAAWHALPPSTRPRTSLAAACSGCGADAMKWCRAAFANRAPITEKPCGLPVPMGDDLAALCARPYGHPEKCVNAASLRTLDLPFAMPVPA